MTFNSLELASILKLAVLMAQADGKVTMDESTMIESVITQKLGLIDESEANRIKRLAGELESPAEMSYIRRMNAEKKEYVAAFLGALMAVDGKIDGKELVLMNLVVNLCELPNITSDRVTDILSIDFNVKKTD